MHFLSQYGLFLLEAITIVAATLITLIGLTSLLDRNKKGNNALTIQKLNEKYDDISEQLNTEILDKAALKAHKKNLKKTQKSLADSKKSKHRLYVINFKGDIQATAVENLRAEISAILLVAKPEDEIVINLESGGGTVHGYGLGASQLQRIREKNIPLTVCIDKVAASGGYLMACVADKILAAPFAIIGSIGVIMQLPNFNRLLKKHDIDYEMLTSGEYKRTVTLLGENTDKGRKKCTEELEEIHHFFKQHIAEYRPQVDVESIGTGEHWLAKKALEFKLVDDLTTSDNYLMERCTSHDVFEVTLERKKKWGEKISENVSLCISKLFSENILKVM